MKVRIRGTYCWLGHAWFSLLLLSLNAVYRCPCLQETSSVALILWQGISTGVLIAVLSFSMWLNLTHGVIHGLWRVMLPVALVVSLSALYTGGWVVLYTSGVTASQGMYSSAWLRLQTCFLMLAAIINREHFKHLARSPVALSFILTFSAAATAYVQINILAVIFNRSGDGMRIVIRLFFLPLVVEACSAVLRIASRLMLRGGVPGVLRGFVLLPVALFNAFVGRHFSTGLNSALLSYILSFAVATLEITMRYSAPLRDKIILRVARRLQRTPCFHHCAALKALCRARHCAAASSSPESSTGDSDKWGDLPPATQHARVARAHFAFMTLDTVAEDIGMLTLIPIAILFRQPTRIGGPPLPVGDVLLRVGFQWLLELWTDVGPFVMYATCHMWLAWRGDQLYTGLTRSVAKAVVGAPPRGQATPYNIDDFATAQANSETHSPTNGETHNVLALSSSSSTTPPAASPKRVVRKGGSGVGEGPPQMSVATPPTPMLDDSHSHEPLAHSPLHLNGGKAPNGLRPPQADEGSLTPPRDDVFAIKPEQGKPQGPDSATQSPPGDTSVCCGAPPPSWRRCFCQLALPCIVHRDVGTAVAQMRDAHAPLLADDGDILWQRLPWRSVRRAMAPGAAESDWGWLHWFTFQNELLAARMSASWQRRQRGWNIWMLLMACTLLGYTLRTTLGPQYVCPFPDSTGAWYWDVCSDVRD